MKNTRKGLGKGQGCGYKNIVPLDSHIHSLSAKGVKTYPKVKTLPVGKDDFSFIYDYVKPKDKVLIRIPRERLQNPDWTNKGFFYRYQNTIGKIKKIDKTIDNTEVIVETYDGRTIPFSPFELRKVKSLNAKGSHLSTIIDRVKHRAEAGGDYKSDPMFEQAVINLMEYMEAWTDYTPEEKKEAIMLFDKYSKQIKGKGMPSHNQRLKEAMGIRNTLDAKGKKINTKFINESWAGMGLNEALRNYKKVTGKDFGWKDDLSPSEFQEQEQRLNNWFYNLKEKDLRKIFYVKNLYSLSALKGNKLKKRLQKLGFKTDNQDWNKPNDNDDYERWEE